MKPSKVDQELEQAENKHSRDPERVRVSAAPWRRSCPAAADSAMGAASASAQGQVATSTAIATQRSCCTRPATMRRTMRSGRSAQPTLHSNPRPSARARVYDTMNEPMSASTDVAVSTSHVTGSTSC